ncbi:hypothetical protein PVK06_043029 [Gossypium arboreum]|uniref:Uncharacterized protein n=1 Tax=Gossypium arboreum TaxID=29729 RepID=A0ABR0MP57_GOSAR|nr:hypothetical protein PVK06_043029 [Gossypium arboreum]
MTERSINVGKIILKEIHDFARKKIGITYFPSLITSFCLRAQVKIKANLKGPYVQSCITAHDLERLLENVHELNPPSELPEPKTDESLNKSKTEANSLIEIEETKSEEEMNDPELIKSSKVSEPKEEPNTDESVEPNVDPELTICMPTSSITVKKSKLSIMMDMMKFMHNQQHAYCKYAKFRDDSIRNAFTNISNNFVPKFPDYVFDS